MKIFFFILLNLLLSCCSNTSFLKQEQKPLHPGKRISILAHESLQNQINDKIILPKIEKNNFWFSSIINQNEVLPENFFLDNKINNSTKLHINKTPSKLYSNFVIDQNILYLINHHSIFAINLDNQTIIWKQQIGGNQDNFGGGLLKISNNLYITNGSDLLHILNTKDGKITYSIKLPNISRTTPFYIDNTIYLSTIENSIYAIDTVNYKFKWQHKSIIERNNLNKYAAITAKYNVVFAPMKTGEVKLLDKDTGQELLDIDIQNNFHTSSNLLFKDISHTPVVSDKNIYILDNSGNFISYHLNDAKIEWKNFFPNYHSFWIAGDFIYLINYEGGVLCIKKDTGQIIWTKNLSIPKKTSNSYILLANNHLFVFNNAGIIYQLSPLNGDLNSIKMIKANIINAPKIANGKIYLLDSKSNLQIISNFNE